MKDWQRYARECGPGILAEILDAPWFDETDATVVSLALLVVRDIGLRRRGHAPAKRTLEAADLDPVAFADTLMRYHAAVQEEKMLRTIPPVLQ